MKIVFEGFLLFAEINCQKRIRWKCSKGSSLKTFANFTTNLDLNSPKLVCEHRLLFRFPFRTVV